MIYILAILGAFLNRARGTRFWEHFSSTSVTRWAFAFGMACIAAAMVLPDMQPVGEVLLFTTFSMYSWCVWGWDAYWSAAIGHDAQHRRLWGLGMLTLRHSLGIPCLIGLSLLTGHWTPFILAPLLFGLPYYVFGYLTPNKAVDNSEYTIGAMWVIGYIAVLRGI